MGMDYEYDPWFFDQTGKEGRNILLWEVGLNAGQLFFAQIQAFEKIFNQPSGFYTYLSGDVILNQPAQLKALIEAMLASWHPTSYPLTPRMFNLPIQMLLVLYRRAIGEWLPAPAALMDTIEQVEAVMSGWEHADE